jgi:nitroreductase
MTPIHFLSSRMSVSKLMAPAPNDAVLERVINAALRAPDHGALRPWRILLVRGDARAAFGDLMVKVERERDPSMDNERAASTKQKAMRAPMIMVVVSTTKALGKIPAIEQVLSAGCVAHGLLLALQAEGFGAVWKTGAPTYATSMKEGLGLQPSDDIVGFLYVGTPSAPQLDSPRPKMADVTTEWTG